MPRTIEEIEADIAAVKATDPNWATSSVYASLNFAYAELLKHSNAAPPAGKDWFPMMFYEDG